MEKNIKKGYKRYKIGEFARIKNIDAQTLRYYDRLGILTPEIVDKDNGYRYYSEKQFIDSDRIKFYKQIGMSLEEIKQFRDLSNMEEVLTVMRDKHQAFEEEVNRVKIIYKNIGRIVDSLETAEAIDREEMTLKVCPDLYCVGGINKILYDPINFEKELYEITKIYPKYSSVGNSFGIISAYDKEVLNQETDLSGIEKQLFLRIDESFAADVNVQRISLGRCLVTYSKKPSLIEGESLDRLRRFVEANDLKVKDKIYVVPIINRFIIESPSDYLYEILLPVE